MHFWRTTGSDPQVGVVGDFECPAPRAFREAAPRIRLDAPGDAPEQELFVVRAARFTEDVAILVLELPDGHVAQGFDLFPQGR